MCSYLKKKHQSTLPILLTLLLLHSTLYPYTSVPYPYTSVLYPTLPTLLPVPTLSNLPYVSIQHPKYSFYSTYSTLNTLLQIPSVLCLLNTTYSTILTLGYLLYNTYFTPPTLHHLLQDTYSRIPILLHLLYCTYSTPPTLLHLLYTTYSTLPTLLHVPPYVLFHFFHNVRQLYQSHQYFPNVWLIDNEYFLNVYDHLILRLLLPYSISLRLDIIYLNDHIYKYVYVY